jgi:ribosome assembly protein RRB1
MRYTRLHRTHYDDDEAGDMDSDSNDLDEDPLLYYRNIPIKSEVNRIRAMDYQPLVAIWNEAGSVQIYNIKRALQDLENINPELTQIGSSQLASSSSNNNGVLIDSFSNS